MKYWKSSCSKKIRNKDLNDDIGNFSSYKKDSERWSAPDDGKFFCHKNSRWISHPEEIKKLTRK